MALMSANGDFVTLTEDDSLEAHSKKAGPGEMIKIRIPLADSDGSSSSKIAKINEDEGDVSQVELNYVYVYTKIFLNLFIDFKFDVRQKWKQFIPGINYIV